MTDKQFGAAIKIVRGLTGAILIGFAGLTLLVFPFLFDDPRTNNPAFIAYNFAVIASFPLCFVLTRARYVAALTKQEWVLGFLYGAMPAMWLMAVVLWGGRIADSIPDPASFGPLKTKNGSELLINRPTDCDIKDHRFRGPYPNANYNGSWSISGGKANFTCGKSNVGLLSIAGTRIKSPMDTVQVVIENDRLIREKDTLFQVHLARWGKGPSFEVFAFKALDGQQVTAKCRVEQSDRCSFHRPLDADFDLVFDLPKPDGGLSGLFETDALVVTYVKSIVRRLK